MAETALPFEPDGSDILIVPEATFIGQGRLVSDLALVPWPNVTEGFSYSLLISDIKGISREARASHMGVPTCRSHASCLLNASNGRAQQSRV